MTSSKSNSGQQRPSQRRRNARSLRPVRAEIEGFKGTHLNGRKISCKVCILGHRSTTCKHDGERDMYYVRKAGRPVMTCNHEPCCRDECQSQDRNQPCCEHVICDRQSNEHVLAKPAPPVLHDDAASESSNGNEDSPSRHESQNHPNGQVIRPERSSNGSSARRPAGGVTHIATYEVRMDANPSSVAADASETIMGNAQNLLAQIHGVHDQRTFETRPATSPTPGAPGMTAENMFSPQSHLNYGFGGLGMNMDFGFPLSFTEQLPDRTRAFPVMDLEYPADEVPLSSSIFNDPNIHTSPPQQPPQAVSHEQLSAGGMMNFESPQQPMMNSLANLQAANMPTSHIQQMAYPMQINHEPPVLDDEWMLMENANQNLDNLLRLSPLIMPSPIADASQHPISNAASYGSYFAGQVSSSPNLPTMTQDSSFNSSLFNSGSLHDSTLDSGYLSSVWSSPGSDNPDMTGHFDNFNFIINNNNNNNNNNN